MNFQALFVSKDREAAAVLGPVLSGFGLGMRCSDYAGAIREITEQKFDAVIVDFEDASQAAAVLQNVCMASQRKKAVTVALLSDRTKVRGAFGAGAHFVLYKPISQEQAQASLRAATILIKRERRRSLRVPVQIPVQLRVNNADIEAILLDLSEDGMELLAANPLCPSATINVQFGLPNSEAPIRVQGEVAWASPNGQSGVRFINLSEGLRTSLGSWVVSNTKKLPPEEPEPMTQCRLTDLSQGGCYVETESPFPENIVVALHLKAGHLEVSAQGLVRVMHPAFGMGIEFASQTAEGSEQMADFIRSLLNSSDPQPELTIMPRGISSSNETAHSEYPFANKFDDALLDLLRGHETLTQNDFLQQLHKQRRAGVLA